MRISRRLFGLIAAAGAMFLAFGCGSGTAANGESTSTSTATSDAVFKVALLTPGPISDEGWSAMAYTGLEAIKSEMGAEISHQEATGDAIKDAMRAYAQKGYNLVFGHGFEYNEIGVEVAKDFPDTVFVSSSGGKTAKNAGAIRFYLEQGFYLAGVFAAKQSRTGVIGMVGGPDVPSIRSTFKAFKAGAEATVPGVKVLETFTGKNDDVAAAKQSALAQIGQGADVLIHQANAGAQGVFDACQEKGVFALGANLNQNANKSGVVIGSATIEAKPAFLELAKLVKEKKFDGSVVTVGMDKKAIDFVLNDALKDKINLAAVPAVDAVRAKILDGSLVVPKDKF